MRWLSAAALVLAEPFALVPPGVVRAAQGAAQDAPSAPGELLVLVARGCSASTWVRTTAAHLLALVGRPCVQLGEATKPQKNPLVNDHALGPGTEKMARALGATGQRGLLKALPVDAKDDAFLEALQAVRARVVLFARTNLLDVELCEARDCFAHTAVRQEAESAGGCKSRRFALPKGLRRAAKPSRAALAASSERLVVPNPPGLVEKLERRGREDAAAGARYERTGLVQASVTFEALTAFEYDATALGRSVAAWEEVLVAFGAPAGPATRRVVEAYLAPTSGTFTARRHADVLTNYAEVKEAFAAAPPHIRELLH